MVLKLEPLSVPVKLFSNFPRQDTMTVLKHTKFVCSIDIWIQVYHARLEPLFYDSDVRNKSYTTKNPSYLIIIKHQQVYTGQGFQGMLMWWLDSHTVFLRRMIFIWTVVDTTNANNKRGELLKLIRTIFMSTLFDRRSGSYFIWNDGRTGITRNNGRIRDTKTAFDCLELIHW